mmetsp:Transcript_30553/g.48943  ORF Transcript_30553/g.48943 Transcript_30553/m.48943 type:complete len:1178 (+) Transcript_30553:106-3639(+)|eukprot:CAMPEP_0203745884 /NCGR_PEP_ID=MMETSP0098-20131031/1485_1 /ASSEMBLY_ACC=CAM_ASM_000208 /TAXON_ID=96639 /ORGANISM=" , Strain NY0313808BC1" /LENGTH=1177 /DNA_ID=CAMNT_0050633793 /DNA_START=188 /DNA_END=3721 /DNA_ORIENTATION=-
MEGGEAFWYEVGCDGDGKMVGAASPSVVCFDGVHDAVVVGWSDGMMSTYDVNTLGMSHTSFKAHPGTVHQITSIGAAGLLSVSASNVCIHGFGGAPYVSASIFDKKEERELTSTLVLDATRIVVGSKTASNGSSLYELDLNRLSSEASVRYLHKFRGGSYDFGVSLLCPTTFGSIICGGSDGKVGMIDLRQGHRMGMPVAAHSGSITDMDVFDTTLVTCGTAKDGRSDPFVKLFDVRMTAKSLGVLQVQARCVRFLRGHEARAIFVGDMGNIHTYCDLNTGTSARVEQIDQIQTGGGTITSMCLSNVGRAVAFVDSAGFIHLWSDDPEWLSTPKNNINVYPEPLPELPHTSFAASEKNMCALELWDEGQSDFVNQSMFLDSDFSPEEEEHFCSNTFPALVMDHHVHEKKIVEINPRLLEKAQSKRDFVGQYIETRSDEFVMNHALLFGKETSKKAYVRDNGVDVDGAGVDEHDTMTAGDDRNDTSTSHLQSPRKKGVNEKNIEKLKAEIPKLYQKPKLTLSKVGRADFDYGKFNETPFAGLDGSLPNSFGIPVLQLLYFQPELRAMLSDFVSNDPNCLATEAGFLFHMLDQAQLVKSKNKCCEARNLLRTFRLAPDAQALGLLEPTQLETDQRAGAFIRFLLEQFSRNHKTLKQGIAEVFGVSLTYREKWLTHGIEESHRSSASSVIDLVYPNELSKAIVTESKLPNYSFCDLLKMTFVQSKKTRLWSKHHNEQLPVVQSKTATKFSRNLLLNCASHDNRSIYLPLYRQKANPQKTFVPLSFKIVVASGGKGVTSVSEVPQAGKEGNKTGEDKQKKHTPNSKVLIFDLVAVISQMYPSNHLVAHVRIPREYANRANSMSANRSLRRRASSSFAGANVEEEEWVLFNDFAVKKVNEDEVVDFRMPYRNPCILSYRQREPQDDKEVTDKQFQQQLSKIKKETASINDEQVFSAPSLAVNARTNKKTFVQLPLEKLPSKGDLVAIDCEMVALTTEESYINRDGRKVVTQQSQRSLARVSCTTHDETVFIDDYIVTPDPIVDYLTRFSGLVPGDLDPQTTTRHLVPLRIAYLKLKKLVDRGCIFVGHGLREDFRVINIFVPPQQIYDTVHLFHLKANRFLSLSFLASYLLDLDIQHKTHDSIEDARTALKVYKEYKKFQKNGTLQLKLTEIYQEGRKRNFR